MDYGSFLTHDVDHPKIPKLWAYLHFYSILRGSLQYDYIIFLFYLGSLLHVYSGVCSANMGMRCSLGKMLRFFASLGYENVC